MLSDPSGGTGTCGTDGSGTSSKANRLLQRALLLLLLFRAVSATPSCKHHSAATPNKHVRLHAFGRTVSLKRALVPSEDVVLYEKPDSEPSVDVLLKLYSEVCTSWRALVDVRFKLLGLVPAVSAVLLATLLLRTEQPDRGAGAIVAAFGLVVTVALALYDQRNSQLHDELVS